MATNSTISHDEPDKQEESHDRRVTVYNQDQIIGNNTGGSTIVPVAGSASTVFINDWLDISNLGFTNTRVKVDPSISYNKPDWAIESTTEINPRHSIPTISNTVLSINDDSTADVGEVVQFLNGTKHIYGIRVLRNNAQAILSRIKQNPEYTNAIIVNPATDVNYAIILSTSVYPTGTLLLDAQLTMFSTADNISTTLSPSPILRLYSQPETPAALFIPSTYGSTVAGNNGSWIVTTDNYFTVLLNSLDFSSELESGDDEEQVVYEWIPYDVTVDNVSQLDVTDLSLFERIFGVFDSYRILTQSSNFPLFSDYPISSIMVSSHPTINTAELYRVNKGNTASAIFKLRLSDINYYGRISAWVWNGIKFVKYNTYNPWRLGNDHMITMTGLELGVLYSFVFCIEVCDVPINPSVTVNVIAPIGMEVTLLDGNFPPLFRVKPSVGLSKVDVTITTGDDTEYESPFDIQRLYRPEYSNLSRYDKMYNFSDLNYKYISPRFDLDWQPNGTSRWVNGGAYLAKFEGYTAYNIKYVDKVVSFYANNDDYDIECSPVMTDNQLALSFNYIMAEGRIVSEFRPVATWEAQLFDPTMVTGMTDAWIWESGCLSTRDNNNRTYVYKISGPGSNPNFFEVNVPVDSLVYYGDNNLTNFVLPPDSTNFGNYHAYVGDALDEITDGFGRGSDDNTIVILTSSLGTQPSNLTIEVPLDTAPDDEYIVEFDMIICGYPNRVTKFNEIAIGTAPSIPDTDQDTGDAYAEITGGDLLESSYYGPNNQWKHIKMHAHVASGNKITIAFTNCEELYDKFVIIKNISVVSSTELTTGVRIPHNISLIMKIMRQNGDIDYDITNNISIINGTDVVPIITPSASWLLDRKVFTGEEIKRSITDIEFRVKGQPPYLAEVLISDTPTGHNESVLYTAAINSSDETIKVYDWAGRTKPAWLRENQFVFWRVRLTKYGVTYYSDMEYPHHRYDLDVPMKLIPFTYTTTNRRIISGPTFIVPKAESPFYKITIPNNIGTIYTKIPYYNTRAIATVYDDYPLVSLTGHNIAITSVPATNLVGDLWDSRFCTVVTGAYSGISECLYITKDAGVSEASVAARDFIRVNQSGSYYVTATMVASGAGSSGIARFGFLHYNNLGGFIGTDPGIYTENTSYLMSGVISGEWQDFYSATSSNYIQIDPPTISPVIGQVSDLFTNTAYIKPYIYISGNIGSGLIITKPEIKSCEALQYYMSADEVRAAVNGENSWISVSCTDSSNNIVTTIAPISEEIVNTNALLYTGPISITGPYSEIDLDKDFIRGAEIIGYGEYVDSGYLVTKRFTTRKQIKSIRIRSNESIPLSFDKTVPWITYTIEFLKTEDTITDEIIERVDIKSLTSYAENPLPTIAIPTQECYAYRITINMKRPITAVSASPKLANIKVLVEVDG